MGRFKRIDRSVSGGKPTKVRQAKQSGRWVDGVWREPMVTRREAPPETDEERLQRYRACAMIMARRFGVRDWHRKYLTEGEVEAIEAERREEV